MPRLADQSWKCIANEISHWPLGTRKIKYIPNNGNAGDALIGAGAMQFFAREKILFEFSRTEDLQAGDFAIYAGGGNLVPSYTECATFLDKCLAVGVAGAAILPHTIRGNEEILKKLDPRFILFCRDHESLAWTELHSSCRAFFAPDMAFGIDVELLEQECSLFSSQIRFGKGLLENPKQLFKYLRWLVRKENVKPDEMGGLRIFRVDVEATEVTGDPRLDLSNLYGSRYRMSFEYSFVSLEFLKILGRADVIETNRLHVGVGGALLGKQVRLHDNSYGKNKAIFMATVAENFPSVALIA